MQVEYFGFFRAVVIEVTKKSKWRAVAALKRKVAQNSSCEMSERDESGERSTGANGP